MGEVRHHSEILVMAAVPYPKVWPGEPGDNVMGFVAGIVVVDVHLQIIAGLRQSRTNRPT
jgi:hypothetical protein